jgi:hypothetical protein
MTSRCRGRKPPRPNTSPQQLLHAGVPGKGGGSPIRPRRPLLRGQGALQPLPLPLQRRLAPQQPLDLRLHLRGGGPRRGEPAAKGAVGSWRRQRRRWHLPAASLVLPMPDGALQPPGCCYPPPPAPPRCRSPPGPPPCLPSRWVPAFRAPGGPQRFCKADSSNPNAQVIPNSRHPHKEARARKKPAKIVRLLARPSDPITTI